MSEESSAAIARQLLFMALVDDPEALDDNFLQLLSELAESKRYRAGEVIFERGKPSDPLVLISDGEVEEDGAAALPFPVLHGLPSALTDAPHRTTLVARTDVAVLNVPKGPFFELLEDQLQTAATLLMSIGTRLDSRRTFHDTSGPRLELGPELTDRVLALRACEALTYAKAETLVSLARISTERQLPDGATLRFDPTLLHVLLAGDVDVFRRGNDEKLRYSGVVLMNVAATFAGTLDTYAGRVVSAATVLTVAREDAITEMRSHFALFRALAAAMMRETRS